jgi:hypothetical protein
LILLLALFDFGEVRIDHWPGQVIIGILAGVRHD